MKNLLLIKTKDRRKFFTYQKNWPMLIEFAKTFGAEVDVVSPADAVEILDLEKLATAFCDSGYTTPAKYEIISKIYPKEERQRSSLLENAIKIRKYIRGRLVKNKPVSLKDLKEKFNDLNLSVSCLCNHLSSVRKEMEQSGHAIVKLGAGKYAVDQ